VTPEQLALDCEPDWIDDLREQPDDRLWDLRGQGLTAIQLHTIQDIELHGSYL
jgi:hypothetical protein